uniref:Transcription initiation factor IIA subunit 2 n=1 Tax=Poecilia latipinna TaxID=48699 RepID=A0A3B3W2K5_9TELE
EVLTRKPREDLQDPSYWVGPSSRTRLQLRRIKIKTQQITPQLALQVLLQFDKAINAALASRVRNRVNFRGSLNTYRFCDNVWTFVLNDVEFREVTELVKVDKVKIVACDGKNSGSNTAE